MPLLKRYTIVIYIIYMYVSIHTRLFIKEGTDNFVHLVHFVSHGPHHVEELRFDGCEFRLVRRQFLRNFGMEVLNVFP